MLRRPLAIALTLLLPPALHAADGDLDSAFAGDGKQVIAAPSAAENTATARAVAGLSDGSILVAGSMGQTSNSSNHFALVKLASDGSPDLAFGSSGIVEVATPESYGIVLAIFVQPDGAIVLAGRDRYSDPSIAFARILANGLPDLSFGPGGLKIIPDVPVPGGNLGGHAIARSPDGGYFVAGSCELCAPNALFVLRLDADCEIDTAFGDDGWAIFTADPGAIHNSIRVAVDEAGRPVVIGATPVATHDLFLVRLTTAGNFDPTFGGGDGIAFVDGAPFSSPDALQLDPVSGRILIAGQSFILARTSTGAVDTGFGTSGVVDLDLEEGTRLNSLQLQSDRKVVAAGSIDHTGAELGGFFLARLETNGTLDNSFDDNGVVRYEFNAAPDAADAAYAAAFVGGKLVAAGAATSPADSAQSSAFAILRTQSALIFTDGFERGSVSGWLGN
ncbi:MAG: hypothetical protein KBA72_01840 [Thermoanaerobaculia bacterium]|nr:hypothetical protein [Thermoanaerobaculia bacterium]